MAKRTRMLTEAEEMNLLNLWLDEEDFSAREKLIRAYMPLANNMAQAFAARGTANLSDLVQEANGALIQAVDNFKRDQKSRISTLARYYIKAALMRHVMDFSGCVRVGTNLHDKKVYANLRRMISDIQAKNGGEPLTDEDREQIAQTLGVNVRSVKRMEPRVFNTDIAIAHTDGMEDNDDGRTVTPSGVIAVKGEQGAVDAEHDQLAMMRKIQAIVRTNFDDRDFEIVSARIKGDMTKEGYDDLVSKFGITIERVRQIQRGGLETIRRGLAQEGINGMSDITL